MDLSYGGARWQRAVPGLLVWIALTVALLRLPPVPPVDAGLDASWSLCLAYLFQHGLQFGSDVVFTFGPLGFAMAGTYGGAGLWLHLLAGAVLSGMSAWVLLAGSESIRLPYRIPALLAVVLLIAPNPDTFLLLEIALLAMLLLREESGGPVRIGACCCILGFFSMLKFTNCLLAFAAVGIAAAYHLLRRDWRRSVLLAAGFAVAFVGWWLICGQALTGIARYVATSLEISKGYEDAMFVYEKAPGWIGFATVLLLAGCGAFEAVAARGRVRSLAPILVFWITTYLVWRHAFIRADRPHMFSLYLWALAPVVLHPAFFPERRWLLARIVLLACIALCAILGIQRTEPRVFARCVPLLIEKLRSNSTALASLPAFKADLDSRYAAVAAKNAAPRLVRTIGSGTVDVLGFQQSVAILNGLNYTPRPDYQSYSTYTPKLEELNLAFMAGPRAPQWILQRYETINHHYPTMDDGLALRALLDRYTYQFQDSGYILWRREADIAQRILPPPTREADAAFNHEIPVGDFPDNASVWLEVDYSYNLPGRLMALVEKPPSVTLVITASDQPGVKRKFRFPRLLAHGGVLLSPYLEAEHDFLKYAVGQGGPKVATFKIDCDHQNARYLQRTFHYRLRLLPPPYNLPRNRTMADRVQPYPMFQTIPLRVEAASPVSSVRLDGREALLACAPSHIELPIPPTGGRLTGAYGLKTEETPGAEAKMPEAEFQIVLSGSGAQRVLFDRVLKPGNAQADCGLQPLDLALPAVAPGFTLQLNTLSKTPKETGANLTCWTALAIKPGPSPMPTE